MPLWTPAQLTSYCWIDFSDTTTLFDATSGGNNVTSGIGIARAEDKSGNGRHFTQGTAGSRPTYTSNRQNGLGAAVYDGGDWLTSSSAASVWKFLHSATFTVLSVVKYGTASNPQAAYGLFGTNGNTSTRIGVGLGYEDRASITSSNNAAFMINGNSTASTPGRVFWHFDATSTIFSGFNNLITPNSFRLIGYFGDATNATAANRAKVAVDGGSKSGDQTFTNTASTSDPSGTAQIGTVGNDVFPLAGDISELIVFDSILSTTNQQLVEGYLAWKWGLQGNLPAGHPYKNGAPAFASDEPGMFGGISGGMTGGFAT